MKPINDHAWMITRNGRKTLVPFDEYNYWIATKIVDRVGYTFVDKEKALRDLEIYNAAQSAAKAIGKLPPGAVVRDGGPAEASTKIAAAPVIEAIVPKDVGEVHVPERSPIDDPGKDKDEGKDEHPEIEIQDSFGE